MSETIFHIREDGTLQELQETSYDSEYLLQKLLFDYPQLLAGAQIDSENPRNWLLIAREMGVPDAEAAAGRWYLDHLFIDQDAIPTLIEVKRSTDTRIRREVIGQMLDYAANAVVYWKIEEIISAFESTCATKNLDPSQEIQNLIGFEESIEAFWEKVQTNMRAGKIRLLLVADSIPKEMKRIIEFLNMQMQPAEILGVEIKQFCAGDSRALVPQLVGQTALTQSKKSAALRSSTGIKRDEASFFAEALEHTGAEKTAVMRKIYDWVQGRGFSIDFGSGQLGSGSFIPYKSHKGNKTSVLCFTVSLWAKGVIEIGFQHASNRPPFDSVDLRQTLKEKLNTINGVDIPEAKIDKRPNFDILLLKEKTEYDKFVAAFEWFFAQYGV